MTDLADLETYLHTHIPISGPMGVTVAEANSRQVVLRASLEANINHKSTAFGGSLQALATLSCWTLLHLNLSTSTKPGEIVITGSNISYIRPVTRDFEAVATRPDATSWHTFLKTFDRRGRGRIQLSAHIFEDDELAVDYAGTFAALKNAHG